MEYNISAITHDVIERKKKEKSYFNFFYIAYFENSK